MLGREESNAAVCLAPETIGAYLDRRLTPDARAQAEAHLATCDACRHWLAESAEIAATLDEAEPGLLTWSEAEALGVAPSTAGPAAAVRTGTTVPTAPTAAGTAAPGTAATVTAAVGTTADTQPAAAPTLTPQWAAAFAKAGLAAPEGWTVAAAPNDAIASAGLAADAIAVDSAAGTVPASAPQAWDDDAPALRLARSGSSIGSSSSSAEAASAVTASSAAASVDSSRAAASTAVAPTAVTHTAAPVARIDGGHARRSRTPWPWVAGLLAAAVLAGIALRGPLAAWLSLDDTARYGTWRTSLVEAVGSRRTLDARLAGGFNYGPVHGPLRSGSGEPELAPAVSIAAARIQQMAEQDPSPQALALLGAARLVTRDFDGAIDTLERARKAWTPGTKPAARAAMLNDLAAAYAARGEHANRADDFTQARNLAALAVAADDGLLEAWFNRALATERIAPADVARQAWNDYLQRDAASPWADEARQRRDALPAS